MLHDDAKLDVALFLNELERVIKGVHELYDQMKATIPLHHNLCDADSYFWRRVEIVRHNVPCNSPEAWAAMSTWLRCATVGINHCQRRVEEMKNEVGPAQQGLDFDSRALTTTSQRQLEAIHMGSLEELVAMVRASRVKTTKEPL